ncbi:MAG: hypothetical protein DRI88_13085, partial [Bacteroidetes bacterium]
ENVADGTYTGVTLSATDVNGDAVTYSVEDGVPFRVEADGTVVVDGDNTIDFETKDSYTFEVTATSADGTSSTQEITVDVNNINEVTIATNDDLSNVGNSHFEPTNATLAGELTFDEGTPTALRGSVTSESDGMVGNSADFSGAKVALEGMDLSSEAGAQTTVSMWIQGNPEGGWEMLAGSNRYDLVLEGGDIGFNTARGDLFGTDASELSDGEWHHVVATFTNGDVTQNSIYIDGQEQDMSQLHGTPSASSANIDSQDGTLFLGSWGASDGYTFTGSMDEVKVFNGSLSSDEVSQLHEIESNNNKWDEVASITSEDTATTITAESLLANDTDADGDTLSITEVTATDDTHGTVSLDADGNVVFTPETNYNGESSFNYTVSDGQGGSDTATITLNVESVNDTPVITIVDTTVVEDTAQVIANVSDIDGTIDSSALTAENGTVAIADNGDITYTPNVDYNGTDSVTISVIDNDGGVTTQTFNVTVDAVNDGPVAVDNGSLTGQTETVFSDNFNDGNADGWSEISFNNRDTGHWETSDGSIGEKSNSADGIIAHDMGDNSTMTDYTIAVDVDANAGNTYNNDVGVTFGYEDNGNYYTVQWVDYSTSYESSSKHGDFNLVKVEDGHKTILDTIDNTELGNEKGQFNLSVDVSTDGGIVISVDGVEKLSAPAEHPQIGTIGLNTGDNDGGVGYDNVVVQNTNATGDIVTDEDSSITIDVLTNDID